VSAGGADGCSAARRYDSDAPLTLLTDPVAQWLDWEQQANLLGFRTSTQPVEVEVASVPRDEVEVYVLPHAPPEIVERFLCGDRVLVARHPLNQDASVAWFDAPVAERWTARFTSSRTLALPGPESGDALFSLKLATDHPHPAFYQPEKTKLREEALGAVEWVELLARVDAFLGPLEGFDLVTEVLVVLDAGGESGFMVRDLRLFQDGHHYLPALSLPWVGRQIVRRHGADFARFWGLHYAAAVGRGKARLLARYGLWYETPNPQNVLVQLDHDARPTGRLSFRDVGDGECATDAFGVAHVPWTRLVRDLRPETQNSFWAFGEAGDHAVGPAVLEQWYAAHDDAWFAELAAWFPAIAPPPGVAANARLDHWNAALRSDAGIEAVHRAFSARHRARFRPEHRLRTPSA
jgi:hypothetical protein